MVQRRFISVSEAGYKERNPILKKYEPGFLIIGHALTLTKTLMVSITEVEAGIFDTQR